MRDFGDRELPDTDRGARTRACRRHGRRRRPESRSGAFSWRVPADEDEALFETRAEKIDRLRRAVECGNYEFDPYLVARAVLEAGVLD